MAANKLVIFGDEDKVPASQPVVAEQPVKQQKTKSLAKSSNLGVQLSMKKVTKSPVPDVLPGLQPNQPVQVKGALNTAPAVIPEVKPQPQPDINPAITHPAAAATTVMPTGFQTVESTKKTKKSVFKPEITHPASLAQPQQQQQQQQLQIQDNNQENQMIPVAEKLKLGNFKERLNKQNKKSKKTNKKPSKKTKKTMKNKPSATKKKTQKEPQKVSTKIIFS